MTLYPQPAIKHLTDKDIVSDQDRADVLTGTIVTCTMIHDYLYVKHTVGTDLLTDENEKQVRVLLKEDLASVHEEFGDELFRQFFHVIQQVHRRKWIKKSGILLLGICQKEIKVLVLFEPYNCTDMQSIAGLF